MNKAELLPLRLCEKPSCDYRVTNGLTDAKDILLAMSNHLDAMHPSLGGSEGGGGASKRTAAISMREEGITETA